MLYENVMSTKIYLYDSLRETNSYRDESKYLTLTIIANNALLKGMRSAAR